MSLEPRPYSPTNPARILIVDDHAIVRHGRSRLVGEEPGLEIGGEAATIETHRAKIMRKLDLENATQLLHRAIAWIEQEIGGEEGSTRG